MFTNLGSIECIFQQVALERSKKEQNIFGLNIRKDMAEQLFVNGKMERRPF